MQAGRCGSMVEEVLMSHPVGCEEIEHEVRQPGTTVGVYLYDIPDGAELEVETKHHCYKIIKLADTQARISGHPMYCPEPITVEIEGSASEGAALKPGFIGRGMHLMFQHPAFNTLTTSRIMDIRRIG
jgi:hypothetical protein